MAEFFADQSDFILFFYGLAFVLLGITCFAISRRATRGPSWNWLGSFGIIHGVGEWLDLSALVIGDNGEFAAIRTAVMTVSYVLLMEFARRELKRQKFWMPGWWIYLPLIGLIVLGGAAEGADEANALARYAIGVAGALGASAVFALHAASFSGLQKKLSILASVGLALYAIAAGAIVPPASFWPADTLNQRWFLDMTGVPIQFVRGVLACGVALFIWGIWGQTLISEVSSARYTRFLHRQFATTLAALLAILFCGWALTEYFGIVHKQHVKEEAGGNLDLLATSLAGEVAPLDAVVRALAGSPAARAALSADQAVGIRLADVLALHVGASGAQLGYVLNRTGAVVAASGSTGGLDIGNLAANPYFSQAMAGEAGHQFAFDAASGRAAYYASFPVRNDSGGVSGVAVLERSLHAFGSKLRNIGSSFFLIDPYGIVALTNRPTMALRTMWPVSPATLQALAPRFGTLKAQPIVKQPIDDGSWTAVNGEPAYVRRSYLNNSGWSLVIVTPVEGIFASRALGIALTLFATIMVLIYLVARERAVHDNVQMDRRLELEELARDLDHKATTDPLTGLSNRLKFDEILGREILRSRRFDTALSLIFYDIDHFKQVNDTYGHPVGDAVLIQLSRFVAERVRATDLLARWGGEEFAILLPNSDGGDAARFAEILKEGIGELNFAKSGNLTCSFGVAELAAGDEADAFLARTDQALYRAKMNGRNRVELAADPGMKANVGSAA